jgi:hypothetical protein
MIESDRERFHGLSGIPMEWLNVGGAIRQARPDRFPTGWKHLIAQNMP